MSSAENDTRPVWLTEADARLYGGGLLRAWDAAPADPAEAIAAVLLDRDYQQPDFSQASPFMQAEYLSLAAIMLRALGVPPERESPTRETP